MWRSEWVDVAHSSPGGGYEWDEFDVQWTNDRFAWSHQSGCSCFGFEYTEDKYQVGDKSDLLRAIMDWSGGAFGGPDDVAYLIAKVHASGH